MNVLFTSFKGGVGKSSLAYNFAVYIGYTYVTNDIIAIADPDIIQIEPKRKRIPAAYCFKQNTVFDFGAMSTQIDPKITQAVQLADIIVIPTLTDPRSLQATIDTVNLVKESGKPVVIIINNFTNQRKFQQARKFLIKQLGRISIYAIRSTTLFERVSQHGKGWLENIRHEKGVYQLNKTREKHERVYQVIADLGGVV